MENNTQTLNPWFSMWTKPRATIQQIVDANPEHLVMTLAAISGFSQSLDRAFMGGLGDGLWDNRYEWLVIVLVAAMVGPIVGIIVLYIVSALTRWTGTWIGGSASSQNIRAALAWSRVPVIWALPLWIPMLFLFGRDLFTTEGPILDSTPSLAFVMLAFSVIMGLVGIWSFVVLLKCLGQVQGFSAWKALGNVALGALAFSIPMMVIIFLVQLV